MSQLDDTTKHALRLAAVGALLHNLGKVHSKFLDRQINNAANDYLFQHILGLIAPYVGSLPLEWQVEFSATALNASSMLDGQTVAALKHPILLPSPLDDRPDYTIGDLIEYLGVQEKWYKEEAGKYGIEYIFPGGSRLTHLMNRAHRGASGGEKEDIAAIQQPDAADLYLSTPFGYEKAAPNSHDINNLLQQIEADIQKHLTAPIDPLSLADVVTDLRPLLSRAIADTQRPLNDVTVGDIGHTGMAFLVTQAVEWILNGRAIDHAELARIEKDNTLLWRVLSVEADLLAFLEDVTSLADLRTRQRQTQETLITIRQKLEESLLAVEVYADEQRWVFVFPNLDHYTSSYQSVAEIINGFNLDGLRLRCSLSKPVSNHPQDAGGSYIGDEVLDLLQKPAPYDFDATTVAAYWKDFAAGKRAEICTACSVRPQGYGADQIPAYKHKPAYYQRKAADRNICCICMNRRSGVAQHWAEKALDTTVWLDEVADSNGRLALVVGRWESGPFAVHHFFPVNVTHMLLTVDEADGVLQEGDRATIRGHAFSWSSAQKAFIGVREAEIPGPYQRQDLFVRPINQQITFEKIVCLADGNYEVMVAAEIFTPGDLYQIGRGNFIAQTATVLATQDPPARELLAQRFWSSANGVRFVVKEGRRAEIIADSVPNYSFARLRRIWQTTQTFWRTALDEPNRNGKPLVPPVSHRLQIVPTNRALDLGDYHAYELKSDNGFTLSVVWDPQRKLFITTDNLDYLPKSKLLGAPVTDFLKSELTLEEPTGYSSQNKDWGKIQIESVVKMDGSSYTPAIPILSEPRTFLALVPAEKALDVVGAIRAKYEREMGKVRNRLPLHLGLVFFHRRTPLRTALDAGRRMLKYRAGALQEELWTVEAISRGGRERAPESLPQNTKHFDQTIAVTLVQNGRTLTWYVPGVMGDGTTPDNWYPYVFIQGDPGGRPRAFQGIRPTADGTGEACWLLHAGELKAGDQVYFTPATFDFEWLDSAGQRFAIAYDAQGRRRDSATRPYLLDDLGTIEQVWNLISGKDGLSSSQIYALRDLIEAKRETWAGGETFTQLCQDAVSNAQWKKRKAIDLCLITDAAVSGLLTDVIQLYMGILKTKPQREENENG